MTVRYSYVDWLQIFRILAAFCFGIAFGVILIHYVHAQDADPRYLCLSDNPTLKQKCEQDEANKLRDLQMRVQIWNLLNCSTRDICTSIAPQIQNETGYYCHDHFGNGTIICHNHKHNMTMPVAQQYVNMTVYPKTLSFCYPVKHLDAVEKVKKDYVECNYVEMPNKKLKHVRDFLENWTAQR